MVKVRLFLHTLTRDGMLQTHAEDTIIPGIPRKGEIVVSDWCEYTVTQVTWNDYANSPDIGVIVDAQRKED